MSMILASDKFNRDEVRSILDQSFEGKGVCVYAHTGEG